MAEHKFNLAYHQYDDAGNLIATKDPNGNLTQFDYSDSWSNTACAPSGQGKAYVTTITNALNQLTERSYASCTGLLTATRDQNDINTSRAGNTIAYDLMNRSVTASFADGGQTTNCYTDVGGSNCTQSGPPYKMVTTTVITNSPALNESTTTTFGGLGRVTQTALTTDPDGTTYTATTYDPLGRVSQIYNPTRCSTPTTNCGESTWGVTTNFYDALGRTCLVVPPDGTLPSGSGCPTTQPANTIFTTYSGNTTTVIDQAGKSRKSVSDALGRLTQVFEQPSDPNYNYETDYTYDALDNLLTVNQKGGSTNSAQWRTRTFVYDSLSRLTSATNPESGAITYAYDANGNLLSKTSPAPNQTGSATVTVSYCYDALNRTTARAYTFSPNTPPVCSNGTFPSPAATYTYDVSSIDGDSLFTNTVGRLVKAAQFGFGNVPANTYYNYDAMGRVKNLAQCAVINCGTFGSNPNWWIVTNTYDLTGDLTSYTDAFGHTLTQTFDGAARPTQLTSSWVDSNHPANLLTVDPSIGYSPSGALRKATFGNSLIETFVYNNRLQPCRLALNSTGIAPGSCTDTNTGNVLDFAYGYGSGNNGNVLSWTAAGQQVFTRNYTYDSLNRISTLAQTAGSAQACGSVYSLSWTIDPWGNRTDQNVTAGTCNAFHQPVSSNNRFTAGSYDAAGNVLGDGTHSYTYDAENRIIQVDGNPGDCSSANACYLYNASGQCVVKQSAHSVRAFYIYGSDGEVVSDTDTNGNWNQTYIHFGGRLTALYRGGSTGFIHQDHLGSTRLETLYPWVNPTQSVYENMDFLPYGEQIAGGSATSHKFTGKERDSESSLDNFTARYLASTFGRFMSADDTDIEDQEADPQGLNLYSYVQNNPTNATDPDGHDCVFLKDNVAYVARGDCTGIANGKYIPGTVDEHSGSYDPVNHTLSFSYTPYLGPSVGGMFDLPSISRGVIGNVYPTHPGPTEFDAFVSRVAAGADDVNAFALQVGLQVGANALGRGLAWGIQAALARAAAAAVDLAKLDQKILTDMAARGWTKQGIIDTIQQAEEGGTAYTVPNRITGGTATEYVSPSTGKFVVVDDTTKKVIQVSGPNFKPNYLTK